MKDPFSTKSQGQNLLDEMKDFKNRMEYERAIRKTEPIEAGEPLDIFKLGLFATGGLIALLLVRDNLMRN